MLWFSSSWYEMLQPRYVEVFTYSNIMLSVTMLLLIGSGPLKAICDYSNTDPMTLYSTGSRTGWRCTQGWPVGCISGATRNCIKRFAANEGVTNSTEVSTPHLRPATGRYPEPVESPSHPTKILYTFLSSLMRATCPARLILLDLIYLMIFGD
jgi:hypothetical protein